MEMQSAAPTEMSEIRADVRDGSNRLYPSIVDKYFGYKQLNLLKGPPNIRAGRSISRGPRPSWLNAVGDFLSPSRAAKSDAEPSIS